MSEATRPLPSTAELDTAAFWTGTREEVFRYPVCVHCSTVIWYPRGHCTQCGSGDLEWRASAGQGRIYSFSVVRQSYHPFFRGRVPYVVAYVDLDEGPRLLTNIVGMEDVGDVRIGARVVLTWEHHEAVAVPLASMC